MSPKNSSPCPENNVIKSRSGKVNSTSGVRRAIVPPPSPQKYAKSKKRWCLVSKKRPVA